MSIREDLTGIFRLQMLKGLLKISLPRNEFLTNGKFILVLVRTCTCQLYVLYGTGASFAVDINFACVHYNRNPIIFAFLVGQYSTVFKRILT